MSPPKWASRNRHSVDVLEGFVCRGFLQSLAWEFGFSRSTPTVSESRVNRDALFLPDVERLPNFGRHQFLWWPNWIR